jgi:hypothetical protein
MTTWFSDHYSDGIEETVLPLLTGIYTPTADIRFSPMRVKAVFLTVTAVQGGDQIRLMTLRSSDRLLALHYSNDGGLSGPSDSTCGLHLAGENHDGAVVDVDLFDTVMPLESALNRDKIYDEGTLTGQDRGLPIWEILGESEDTKVDYDVTITAGENQTGTGKIGMQAYYLAV